MLQKWQNSIFIVTWPEMAIYTINFNDLKFMGFYLIMQSTDRSKLGQLKDLPHKLNFEIWILSKPDSPKNFTWFSSHNSTSSKICTVLYIGTSKFDFEGSKNPPLRIFQLFLRNRVCIWVCRNMMYKSCEKCRDKYVFTKTNILHT